MTKESLISEKQQLDEEKDEQFRLKTNLEFDIGDLKDSEKNDRESRVRLFFLRFHLWQAIAF